MKLLLFVYCFFTLFLFSQENNSRKIDTLNITFKAKMLTLERQGVINKNYLLKSIEERNVDFLRTIYSNFLFLKVTGKPPIGWYKNQYCSYYLAYNIKTQMFYRIGGFDFLDINNFFKDLFEREVPSMNFNDDVVGLDLECLFRFYILPTKKRLKKKNICYCTCSEEIIEVIENRE